MQGGGSLHKLTEPIRPPIQNPTHPQQSEAKRTRYKESTEVELVPEKDTLPQKDYEGSGEYYVGRLVSKAFDGTKYRGIVTNCDVDNVTGGEIWEVTYEDMDMEDLHHHELMKVLMPAKDGKGEGGGNQNKIDNSNPISPPRT